LSGQTFPMPFTIDGRPPTSGVARPSGAPEPQQTANYFAVTRGYFAAMRIPLLAGRDFDAHDTADRPFVAIINRTFARQYFPNDDPIGKRVVLDFVPNERPREIVAVVGDTSFGPLVNGRDAVIYVPHLQQTPHFIGAQVYTRTWMNFVVRTG